MKTIFLVLCLVLVGCTDAVKKEWTTLGSTGNIKCYSGGRLIYEGTSTGKVATVSQSDGWQFEDAKTHKYVRVSGDCLIEN